MTLVLLPIICRFPPTCAPIVLTKTPAFKYFHCTYRDTNRSNRRLYATDCICAMLETAAQNQKGITAGKYRHTIARTLSNLIAENVSIFISQSKNQFI